METTLKQQVLTQITALPESANFEEILHALRALRPKQTSAHSKKLRKQKKPVSCLDLAKPVIGVFEGPEDLSTNKAYFEGFGE